MFGKQDDAGALCSEDQAEDERVNAFLSALMSDVHDSAVRNQQAAEDAVLTCLLPEDVIQQDFSFDTDAICAGDRSTIPDRLERHQTGCLLTVKFSCQTPDDWEDGNLIMIERRFRCL